MTYIAVESKGRMKIIIANSRTEEMAGDLRQLVADEAERLIGAWGAQRMLWFAEDDDVVVLPWAPPASYLDYVTGITGVDADTLTILVPPVGELGEALLTVDRILDEGLIGRVRRAIDVKNVERIVSCYDDQSIVAFARAVGALDALGGHAFTAQGGVGMVNSKGAFRAIAAGTNVPLAPGAVTSDRVQAEQVITSILRDGHPVMIKQEFNSGGFGNLILSPTQGVKASGAFEVLDVQPEQVGEFLAEKWSWMTNEGRNRAVIERYFTDCITVYAESDVREGAVVLSGVGQILMEPVAAGEIVPPQDVAAQAMLDVAAGGERLCEIYGALGYRGYMSADAIVTPQGEVFFTETNGRVTGSTHLHLVLKRRVLGRRNHLNRVLLEREGWKVPSYEAAVEALSKSKLGYDEESGIGVVITANYVPVDKSVMYCAIAPSYSEAARLEKALHEYAFAVE